MVEEFTLEDIRIKQLKEDVFHKYFKKEVINYPVSREGQSVDMFLNIANTNLDIHFEKMAHKYGFKSNRQDIQTEYIYQSFEAIMRFEPKVENIELGWEAILNGLDEHLENQLLKYIRETVKHEIWKFANPDAFKTTTMQDGEKIHYILVMEMESLDDLLYTDYEERAPVQLTDENTVFDNTMYSYYITFFQKWFDDRKEDILTDSQVKFLKDVKKLSKDSYLTAEEFEEVTGVKWENYSKRLRTIEGRVSRAWEKENPTNKSVKQVNLEPKIKYLQGFLDMIEDFKYRDNDLNTQNLRLTDYLVEGMSDKEVEHEVFKISNEVFNLEELVLFNRIVNNKNEKRVSLRVSSLIKVADSVESLLGSLLKNYEIKVEYDLSKSEAKNTNKPNIQKADRKTEITTYNKNGKIMGKQTKLIRDNPSNVFYMLPTGVMSHKKG